MAAASDDFFMVSSSQSRLLVRQMISLMMMILICVYIMLISLSVCLCEAWNLLAQIDLGKVAAIVAKGVKISTDQFPPKNN